jgi:putative DNA primase/helicase
MRDRSAVRIKIKRRSGRYLNWYRVASANGDGWQAGKPDDYESCPYTGKFDGFDPEFSADPLYWPEGEKDCDTLSRQGLPAFTFGGTGDGLPPNIDRYLEGREIIILADNDIGGKMHAIKKAERAHAAGAAAVRLVDFPELPVKGDVSDFLEVGNIKDLEDRVRQTVLWKPSIAPGDTETALARELVTCNLSDISPAKIDWIWPGRIAVGKLTILAGEPGLGKSQVALYVASTITRGAKWIGSVDQARRGRVLMLSAEDGLADTVRPRFDAAGGDPSMVSVIRAIRSGPVHGTFNLAADLMLLEREISRHGNVELVIMDPLSSYMPNVDSHKNTEVRSVLEPISEMAERLKVGILATTHLSKGDGKAIYRVIGSIAFVAAARAVFTVVEDPEEEGRRLLLSVKNNIARAQPGLAFRLEQREVALGVVGSFVAWDENVEVKVTADQVLSGAGEQPSTKSDAVQFLLDLLANGPMPVRDLEQQAVEASLLAEGKPIGQSKPFRLARADLDIKSRRAGGLAGSGQWVWELTGSKVPLHRYDAQVHEVGTLETIGHLSDVKGSA